MEWVARYDRSWVEYSFYLTKHCVTVSSLSFPQLLIVLWSSSFIELTAAYHCHSKLGALAGIVVHMISKSRSWSGRLSILFLSCRSLFSWISMFSDPMKLVSISEKICLGNPRGNNEPSDNLQTFFSVQVFWNIQGYCFSRKQKESTMQRLSSSSASL